MVLRICARTRQYQDALHLLRNPITSFMPSLPTQPKTDDRPPRADLSLHYTDHLIYFYSGGVVYAALGDLKEAEEFLETAVTAPVHGHPSAIQLEALKKLVLIQLMLYGKVSVCRASKMFSMSNFIADERPTQVRVRVIHAPHEVDTLRALLVHLSTPASGAPQAA